MNKIEYNGNVLADLDAINQAVTTTNNHTTEISNLTNTKVSSNEVKEIKVVTDYPSTEQNGVLYIKLES